MDFHEFQSRGNDKILQQHVSTLDIKNHSKILRQRQRLSLTIHDGVGRRGTNSHDTLSVHTSSRSLFLPMDSHGQLFNTGRANDAGSFLGFPDFLGDQHHEENEIDPFAVGDGFSREQLHQRWAAELSFPDSDPWTQPDMVNTSFENSMEEEERVDLSFSSPDRNSFFPKVGTTQDFSWPPEEVFSSPEGSPTRTGFEGASALNTSPILEDFASIIMEERLSILFDGMSSEPACRVIGRIHVRFFYQFVMMIPLLPVSHWSLFPT